MSHFNCGVNSSERLGRALDLVLFVKSRKRQFDADDLAAELEVSKRTAWRWLQVAEARGLVEPTKPIRHGQHTWWRAVGSI